MFAVTAEFLFLFWYSTRSVIFANECESAAAKFTQDDGTTWSHRSTWRILVTCIEKILAVSIENLRGRKCNV